MRSEFLPFSPPSIGDAEIAAVVDTLRSDWITTGPKVKNFEQAFAQRMGEPAALAVSSCTDALQVALAALGVGPGDAVFTTTMTFCATAHVVEHLGATPVLVDIERDTLNIDPERLDDAVRGVVARGELRPRAIIPVHFAGHPVDMAAVFEIAGRYELAVIEDAAHALPATWSGNTVGSITPSGLPHAVAFSFYATKNITTAEGGMLTASPELLEEARLWSLHGMSRDAWNRYGKGGAWRYDVIRPGFKCNMTDIAAALGLVQLGRLGAFQDRRQAVASRYRSAFEQLDSVESPTVRPDIEPAWHLYPLRLHLDKLSIDRERFIDELTRRNIGSSVHFIPLHLMSFYRDKYHWSPDDYPIASQEFERLVSLPIHPRLADEDVEDVIQAVTEIVSEFRK
jgi:dTDP-4-amino-4,6-dideoxygalactose transaminase